jgi:putative Mg2+ transporter-C (MgtC) family protein
LRGHHGQLRVCVLVCIAAAAFSDLVVTRADSSNWANGFGSIAQGVGFLGAGLIMKDPTIRGVSTAATLWCVAAVGAAAGAREIVSAMVVTLIVLGVNVVLRPISRWARRHETGANSETE